MASSFDRFSRAQRFGSMALSAPAGGAIAPARRGATRAVGRRGALTSAALGSAAIGLSLLAVALAGGFGGAAGSRSLAGRTAPALGWASLPSGADVAVSRGLGADSSSFFAKRTGLGSAVLSNSQQGLHATVNRGAVTLSGRRGLLVGLSAATVGRSGAAAAAGFGAARVNRNRVVFSGAGVREWFANGPLGVEQGFTVTHRPAGEGALVVTQRLAPGVRASVAHGGQAVTLTTSAGSLSYRNLAVTDVRGEAVPARLSVSGGRLMIRVDDAHAHYPLRIDPVYAQDAELTASDPYGYDDAGAAVAVSGSTIVVGAPYGGSQLQGVVYVFTLPAAGGWVNATQTAELAASDGARHDELGDSVAVSGSTVVAGAPYHGNFGAVYEWTMPSGGWSGTPSAPMTQTAELTTSDPDADYLGGQVAVSGTTIVAGNALAAIGHKHRLIGSDRYLYVWTMPSGGWATASDPMSETADLAGTDVGKGNNLGASLATDSSTIVAGDPEGGAAGVVYVWSEPAGGWSGTLADPLGQTAELTASDDLSDGYLGASVGVAGSTIVAGDPYHNSRQGTVYVWSMPSGGWVTTGTQTAELTAADGDGDDQLGTSVAIDGSTVVAGAPVHPDDNDVGAVYEWSMPSGGWVAAANPMSESAELVAADGADDDDFGLAVALSGSTVVSGAPYHMPAGGLNEQGAAYVFHPIVSAATVSLSLSPPSITADGSSSSTATFTVRDTGGSPVPGDDVTITSNGGQTLGPVSPGPMPGTYQATITSTDTVGSATITATDVTAGGALATAQLTQTARPLTESSSAFRIIRVRSHADGSIAVRVRAPDGGALVALATHADGSLVHVARVLSPGGSRFVYGFSTRSVGQTGDFTITIKPTPAALRLLAEIPHPHLHLLVAFFVPGGGASYRSKQIRF